jgi:hypothetical protein
MRLLKDKNKIESIRSVLHWINEGHNEDRKHKKGPS